MKLSKIVLLSGGLIYLAFGLLFFLNPYTITEMDGIILPTSSSANHIRAILGGTEMGLGFLLILFAFKREYLQQGLLVLFFSIGLASLARFYGILFTEAGDTSNIVSFAAELFFACAAMVCFVYNRRKLSVKNKYEYN